MTGVEELQRVSPLLDERGLRTIERIARHPDAPRFNRVAGDRLERDDLYAVEAFRAALNEQRAPFGETPPERTLRWVSSLRSRVPSFRERVPAARPLERAWTAIATTSREDLALRPEGFVPDDAPLERMIVYRTAGTTGHALLVPHDVRAAASYLPLLELALGRWGVEARFDADDVTMLVGAQSRTVTYATALAAWGQAGFAKLNLSRAEWPRDDAPARFFRDLAPSLLTGDPVAFAELMARGVAVRPRALVTTAVAMSDVLRARLSVRFDAPVIDWYSLTETGPIGYACPLGGGAYHVLSHDLFVEVLGPTGVAVPEEVRGEIVVTGGRNPFLPLLRYRTGDWGRIERAPCACGDPMPRIVALDGRAPVVLRGSEGRRVNPVDVSAVLRAHPVVQHELVQRSDLSCELAVRSMQDAPVDLAVLERELRALFGGLPLEVRDAPTLGDRTGKVVSYRSDLPFEE